MTQLLEKHSNETDAAVTLNVDADRAEMTNQIGTHDVMLTGFLQHRELESMRSEKLNLHLSLGGSTSSSSYAAASRDFTNNLINILMYIKIT